MRFATGFFFYSLLLSASLVPPAFAKEQEFQLTNSTAVDAKSSNVPSGAVASKNADDSAEGPKSNNKNQDVGTAGDNSTATAGGSRKGSTPLKQPSGAYSTASGGDDTKDSTPFKHFIAHNKTMTCSADEHAQPFNNQVRGVNLGGWMVLEPWITPSLFYQFLGGNENTTAMDTYTFCEVLGPEEANRQLRRHWESWVTEEIIDELAASGAVNSLRLPVGDYMYKPYGPYHGCFDGALKHVEQVLDWAYARGLTVLLDIHALKGSQNGFDNSGQSLGLQWTSKLTTEPAGLVTFEHWPIRTAEWMGEFDLVNTSYPNINYDNIQHALDVIEIIVDNYGDHPAVLGLEPVNEPWQYTPIDELKKFYWEGYLIVKRKAPYWKYIMHDSFRFDNNTWGGFMAGCPERAMDTHIYQAWNEPNSRISFYQDACRQKKIIAKMERDFGPVIVGEWSLATDNCAMWLNGFNDNLPGFPRLPCKYIPCSESYIFNQTGTPLDRTKAMQGPFGTGMSGPIFGLCPVGRDWLKESSGNPYTGRDWVRAPPEAPAHLDDTKDVMTNLANKKINAFSGIGHGFYFWNFRTDLYDPQWSYMLALELGYIPKGNLDDDKIWNACAKEDSSEIRCVVNKKAPEKSIKDALAYIYNVENKTKFEREEVQNMTGPELYATASEAFTEFFETARKEGATCDFGGAATLLEVSRNNRTSDYGFDDDEYFEPAYSEEPVIWNIILIVASTTFAMTVALFIIAMRLSRTFNKQVRNASFFRPITRSRSHTLRAALNLPADDGYEEIPRTLKGY